MDEEEALIVKPLIKEIMDLEKEFKKNDRQARKELRELLDNEAISTDLLKEKLDEIRQQQTEFNEQKSKLTGELKELLIFDQEAELVLLGILK